MGICRWRFIATTEQGKTYLFKVYATNMRLREVSFNGNESRYDIRTWKTDENGERMGKGIQLTGEEMEKLCEMLCKIRDAE